MPRKNTAAQLMSAMRRLFHKGYQSTCFHLPISSHSRALLFPASGIPFGQ